MVPAGIFPSERYFNDLVFSRQTAIYSLIRVAGGIDLVETRRIENIFLGNIRDAMKNGDEFHLSLAKINPT